MLKIRLQRTGKKNEPHFRLVLTEKTSAPKSKALEILGHYNPRKKDKAFKKDRILYWVSVGAQMSDTAFNLLHNENIVEGQKIVKKKISKKKREEIKKQEAEAVEAKEKQEAADKIETEKTEEVKEEAAKEVEKEDSKTEEKASEKEETVSEEKAEKTEEDTKK